MDKKKIIIDTINNISDLETIEYLYVFLVDAMGAYYVSKKEYSPAECDSEQ